MKEVNKEKDNNIKKDSSKEIDLVMLETEIREDICENDKNSSLKIITLIVSLLILILLFISLHIFVPNITIIGDEVLELSYHDNYIEQGATVKLLKRNLTSKLKITGSVDTSKVGKYTITYKVNYGIFKIKNTRKVLVVDRVKPTIELTGEKEVNICPNKDFIELGYTAYDEYDGDITSKVKIDKKEDRIIYTVEDSSKNKYSITRKINKIDKEKPEITLKGNSTIYLSLEDKYQEPGYEALDNCSGDITSKVEVSGEVKEKTEGIYTLTYQVEDDSGNKTHITREVRVFKKTDPNSGVIKNGAIYLTFDDGPSATTTAKILDVLKEEGVKATFFVTNNGPDYLIKRMYDEGHTIALHTASHDYSVVYKSEDNYFNDLKTVSDRVERITGQKSMIVRFPGGSSNTVSRRYSQGIMSRLSELLFNQGYRYYDWNVDSMDASTARSKDDVYRNVTNQLSKSRANMVLMHDIKYPTMEAIRDIIRYGKQNGYTFEKIDMNTYMVRQRINN